MKRTCLIAALMLCAGAAPADAGLFGCFKKKSRCHARCAPSCAAPAECCPAAEPSCCAPAEPTCCVPAEPAVGVPVEAVPMTQPAPVPAEPAPAPPEETPVPVDPQAFLESLMEEAFFPAEIPPAPLRGAASGERLDMANRITIAK